MLSKSEAMSKLKDIHKQFIIRELACYKSPTDVIEQLEVLFGLKDVLVSKIVYYNPEASSSTRLAKKWRDLFYESRSKFIKGFTDIPITNKRYRLMELQKSHDKCRKSGMDIEANAILKQAQDEMKGIEGDTPKARSDNYYDRMNELIKESLSNN